MSSELLLSIVTVTFNDKDALELTLNSCRLQHGDNDDCEIIVIDGGSADETLAVIEEGSDVISMYVSEPDRGIYDAMNKGLALASGRYVMYLNSGDVWRDHNSLQAVRAALLSCSSKWLIGAAVSLDGGERERTVKNIPHSWWRHALGLQAHCHQSTIIERQLMISLGGFSEEYDFIGDFDMIMRVGLTASPSYLREVIVTYAGGGISAMNRNRISALQRKVRSDRMQFGTLGEGLNGLYMKYHNVRRSLLPAAGALRRLMRSASRRRRRGLRCCK